MTRAEILRLYEDWKPDEPITLSNDPLITDAYILAVDEYERLLALCREHLTDIKRAFFLGDKCEQTTAALLAQIAEPEATEICNRCQQLTWIDHPHMRLNKDTNDMEPCK